MALMAWYAVSKQEKHDSDCLCLIICALTIKKSEALEAARPIGAGAYPGFCSMKRLEVFQVFPNNSLVPICTPGWREAL